MTGIIKKLTSRILGKKFYCPVCQNRVSNFEPIPDYYFKQADKHGFIFSFSDFETLNLNHYQCPNCGSSDRDRLYALYFEQIVNVGEIESMLDFAPGDSISKFLRSRIGSSYRTADLMKSDVDDIGVNIEAMTLYKDESFDFLICSHVLEHVANPNVAIKELHRVLKTGSKAIIMVPIMTTLENDVEDPSHLSESSRWKYYGQDDHVRMFSKNGFLNLLYSAGFQVSQLTQVDFGPSVFEKYGIDSRSVLYVVTK